MGLMMGATGNEFRNQSLFKHLEYWVRNDLQTSFSSWQIRNSLEVREGWNKLLEHVPHFFFSLLLSPSTLLTWYIYIVNIFLICLHVSHPLHKGEPIIPSPEELCSPRSRRFPQVPPQLSHVNIYWKCLQSEVIISYYFHKVKRWCEDRKSVV